MPLPPFIERDGDPQIPPPYWFPDVSIRSFRLFADLGKLQALCDTLLNDVGTLAQRGFEYRPILPFVDLEVLTYPRMESGVARYRQKGYTAQREMYFRLLVAKIKQVFGVPVPTEIAVFIPYIFVDNNWSVITGREVVGYPKAHASFEMSSSKPYPMTIRTDVFEKYDPNTKQTFRKLVEVNGTSPDPSVLGTYTAWPWGVLDLADLDLQMLWVLQEFMALNSFPAVQLKQIRDAETNDLACYQALVHAEFEVTNLSAPDPLPTAEITIHPYDSLPIADELGLGSGALEPLSQYSVECDLKFSNTYNLFVRP